MNFEDFPNVNVVIVDINKDLAVGEKSLELSFKQYNTDLVPAFYDLYFKSFMEGL
jgi:hypothetical protein